VRTSATREAEADRVTGEAASALAETDGFSRDERRAILAVAVQPALGSEAMDRVCVGALGDSGPRDFAWPEFDRWYAVFARHGIFPPLWHGLERRPDPHRAPSAWQLYQRRKFYLLVNWLHALTTGRIEARAALVRYATRGLQAEIVRQAADVICPACAPLNHEQVYVDSRDVPPFHPGCRCLVLASRPLRRAGIATPRDARKARGRLALERRDIA